MPTTPPPSGTATAVRLPARPVLLFWSVATLIQIPVATAFLLVGADAELARGLAAAGLEFRTDLLAGVLVVIAYPAAALGVALSLAQVAAPDLAVLGVAARRGGRALLRDVAARLRPWSRAVGRRSGLRVWAAAVAVLTLCNLASGFLHRGLNPEALTWTIGWGTLALLPVAMFLDAGALLEENGWRGFALPALLRRHTPVVASLVLGLAWASWHYLVKFDLFVDYGALGAVAVLAAFTLKIIALTIVITYFWARSGQSTLLAIAMHGLSNDVARVGGWVEPTTWQVEAVTELNLAVPLAVAAAVCVGAARRNGWGDVRPLGVWRP
ncbi:MAG TPA: CPBP family intramembrane glutamic endopeptidase [Pseudonocardia sp.]|nr:CPBP family intramembrane glutamic endopeptidase [Pseudonocardia sp.]